MVLPTLVQLQFLVLSSSALLFVQASASLSDGGNGYLPLRGSELSGDSLFPFQHRSIESIHPALEARDPASSDPPASCYSVCFEGSLDNVPSCDTDTGSVACACSPVAMADFAKCFTCAEDVDPGGAFLLGPDGTSWSAETWVGALASSCLEASASVLPSTLPSDTASTLPLSIIESNLLSAAPTTSGDVDPSTLLESDSLTSSDAPSSTTLNAPSSTTHVHTPSTTHTSPLAIVTVVATTTLISSSRFVTSQVGPLTLSQSRASSSSSKSIPVPSATSTDGVDVEVISGPARSSSGFRKGGKEGGMGLWVAFVVASAGLVLA